MKRSFKYYVDEFQTTAKLVACAQCLEDPATCHIGKNVLGFRLSSSKC
jgi:hypothetical protein